MIPKFNRARRAIGLGFDMASSNRFTPSNPAAMPSHEGNAEWSKRTPNGCVSKNKLATARPRQTLQIWFLADLVAGPCWWIPRTLILKTRALRPFTNRRRVLHRSASLWFQPRKNGQVGIGCPLKLLYIVGSNKSPLEVITDSGSGPFTCASVAPPLFHNTSREACESSRWRSLGAHSNFQRD